MSRFAVVASLLVSNAVLAAGPANECDVPAGYTDISDSVTLVRLLEDPDGPHDFLLEPVSALIVGDNHTLESITSSKEIIVGNGGAPLTTGSNYGYVIASRRASDGAIVFNGYDYQTGAMTLTVVYSPTGTVTQ